MALNFVRASKIAAAAGALTVMTASASADLLGNYISVSAVTENGGVGQIAFPISPGDWNGVGDFEWELPWVPGNVGNIIDPSRVIWDQNNNPIGYLSSARLSVIDDPVVNANFNVSSGFFNTTFTVNSSLLTFPVIPVAIGQASAAISVTDILGDGATISVVNGAGMYAARYNGFFPGGSVFENLLTSTQSFVGGTQTFNDNTGPFALVAGPVSDISARFEFSLSPFDSASGTSTFEVIPIPAPAAGMLIGIGGLVALRRRR